MIDFELTEEQKMLKQMAHDFAEKEIRPNAMKWDHEPDSEKAFNMAWDVAKKGFQLGFGKMRVPEKYGGNGCSNRDWVVFFEEIAWGDAGVATTFNVSQGVAMQIAVDGNEEVKQKWLVPYCEDKTGEFVFCGSMTEPAGGTEMICPLDDPALGMKDRAVLEGDEYILNASRLFCTNSSVAKVMLISMRTDPKKRNWDSITDFVVPMNTPGVSVGKPFNMTGFRGSGQCEVVLDNVRLPKSSYFAPVDINWGAYMTSGINIGTRGVAIARSAYEEALSFTTDRKIWGMRLRDHELVASKLTEMRIKIEQARALIWKIAWALDNKKESDGFFKFIPMAMIAGATVAREVTTEAINLMGTYGATKDCPVEKYARDAVMVALPDAGINVQKIFLAQRL
jgi:acyl-CoA dehydrogenase